MDSKTDCAGTYFDGHFIWDKIPDGITQTWAYSEHLFGRDIDYANLLVSGRSIDDVCPEFLRERWETASKLIKAHFKGCNTAKINIDDVCFYEIVPRKHLQHYFDTKSQITQWVFDNHERPENYYFLKNLQTAVKELKRHPVNLNAFGVYCHSADDLKAKQLYDQFGETTPYVDYDIFGTVTGRMTTKRGSFPALNLKRELKKHVRPNNDVFLELDFNAAEIRTMLALQGHEQPEEDIHEWNIKEVFKKDLSRDEAKTKIFAWLYNQESKAIKSNYYDREILLEKYFKEGVVETPFGRSIAAPVRKALNYLLQSSSSDNTLERFIRVSNFLRATKSHVAFVVHDSVVIDLHKDDKRLIPTLKEMFGDTKLGQFKVNCSLGKNLGDMKEFVW
tara:strand:- start:403 stop:1575 length:1173 start_codon:yes stop_codon:yes gene_type:complete